MIIIDLPDPIAFDWDEGNRNKNLKKHNVEIFEAEQVVFNNPVLLSTHLTEDEKRFLALGKTNSDRNLTLIFTIRQNKIRIISARDMSKKERLLYEETKKIKTNS